MLLGFLAGDFLDASSTLCLVSSRPMRPKEASTFSARSAGIMRFRVQWEKMFPPVVGNCMLLTSFLLLVFAACAVPSLVKVTQGHF